MSSSPHDAHLRRALSLARRARGRTSPNPMVGALVVRNGRTVGHGYHQRSGGPHAEVIALEEAGKRARGATLYVTLEPCSHHGKTPPCVDAIIDAQVARVVVGMGDPNPLVSGRGIKALRAADIEVEIGVLEQECRDLNEAFTVFITTGRPFVQLKLASSLDGHIATAAGQSKWLTGGRARTHVHRLRASVDAVMVGAGTALADDPSLTVRLTGRTPRQPARVVVDSHCRLPADARLLHGTEGGPVIVATTRSARRSDRERLSKAGAEVIVLASAKRRVKLTALLDALGERDITNVLVEGGSEIGTALLDQGLVNKVLIYYAPLFLGEGSHPMVRSLGIRSIAAAPRLERIRVQRFDDDVLVTGYPSREEGACSPD